jgi:thiol-disulfide isomerase/thioredoxin
MNRRRIVFFFLTALMLLLGLSTFSQSGKIPPFKMIQANGKVFFAGNLPMEKPIVITYFSPDCDDCQLLIESILERMVDFKNSSIVMITYLSVETVKQFVTKYSLSKYSNIFVGTEGNSLFVRNYYNVQQFPFLTLYNKNDCL